jgi:hypothetical protein
MSWKNNYYEKNKHHTYYFRKQPFVYPETDLRDGYTCYRPSKYHYAGYLLKKIWSDRKLRLLLILSFVVIKILIILALVFILPAIGDFTDIVSQKGLKGIFELALTFLATLWNGA